MNMDQLRIGVLGAARIVPSALLSPAQQVPEASVVTIGARDTRRAQEFARKHQIPRVAASYDDVLSDPEVDAVYIPLPNSLHARWTLQALKAGKHVLCEKPFAANADEAEEMARAAEQAGKVVMEAFHYRYHPLATRMKEIVTSGVLGKIRHIAVWICIPLPLPGDIRYRYDLAGGATMDTGSYAISILRLLAGDDLEVVYAEPRVTLPQIDRWMMADFLGPDGMTARMVCSLFSTDILRLEVRVLGELGEMTVINPIMPQLYHRLTLRIGQEKQVEHFSRTPTYVYQLQAFTNAILYGTPILTTPVDALINMRLIDEVYERAGLLRRGLETV